MDKSYGMQDRKKLLCKRWSFPRNILEKPRSSNISCSLSTESIELPNLRSQRKIKSRKELGELSCTELPEMAFVTDECEFENSSGLSSDTNSWCDYLLRVKTEQNVKSDVPEGNIIGPSECQKFKAPISPIDLNDYITDQTPIEESHALSNWNKWMAIRRRQNEYLTQKLKRNKCCLVMNRAENLRKKIEEKTLLSYISVPGDKNGQTRSDDCKQPVKLPEKCMRIKYHSPNKGHEKGDEPLIEDVSVPVAIKMEKDVFCDDIDFFNKDLWADSIYRIQQRKKYKEEIEKIMPHTVEGDELIIIGKSINHEKKARGIKKNKLSCAEFLYPSFEEKEEIESEIQLAINGVLLKIPRTNGEITEDSHIWSLIFENSSVGTMTQRALHIGNNGVVAIRYEWLYVDSNHQDFPWTTANTEGRCFFFNKNPGVLLPGERKDIIFYHYSKFPGIHTETWDLKFDPNIFGKAKTGKVKLTAVSKSLFCVENVLATDDYLEVCLRDSIMRAILLEIFERIWRFVPQKLEYRSLFMEEELFEFQNPAHFYCHEIVGELRAIFNEIPLEHLQEWDMNLFTLEGLIRTYAPYNLQQEMLCKLMELSRALLRPGREGGKINKKYKMLYNALCSIIDKIGESGEIIREAFMSYDGTKLLSKDEEKIREQEEIENDEELIPENLSSLSRIGGSALQITSVTEPRKKNPYFEIPFEHLSHYKYYLYMMVFHYLCEAVESAAGIIETCRLFEHRGEIIHQENICFMLEQNKGICRKNPS